MQALHNIMADLGLASETPAENSKTNAAETSNGTTAASGSNSHDKTAAEEVKDKAVTYEAGLDRSDSQPITRNAEEAHARPTPPALVSRDTAGTTTTDGADDNASMMPLGKGRPSDTLLNESGPATPAHASAPSTIAEEETPAASTTAHEGHPEIGKSSGLTRSTSVVIAPSREEIDAAKSAIIMAVASCPVNREVSFSDTDNGTDTGRLEVRQILKGYKGIDAAINEMNRSVKITVLNANPMSAEKAKETFGLKDGGGEGNASFAKAGSITPNHEGTSATSSMPVISENRGLESAAPVHPKQPDQESVLSQKAALATAPTSDVRPTAVEKRSSTFMPTSPGKPGFDRLNTLQREELNKIPSAEENRAVQSEQVAEPTVAAIGTGTKHHHDDGVAAAPVSTRASTADGPRTAEQGDSLAAKLRREMEERAQATREGRSARDTTETTDSGPSTSHVESGSYPKAEMVSAMPLMEKQAQATGESGSSASYPKAEMVSAMPLLEGREKEEGREVKETEAQLAPTVMTDLTPEPMSTGPASSVSEATETSKPSAFTEEFEKPAPISTTTEDEVAAVEPSTTAETPATTSATPIATSSTTTSKESAKVSYANNNGNRRASKDAKSGGFLSGLFRRRSQKADSPSKANGVPTKTVSEPVKAAPVVEKEEEKTVAPVSTGTTSEPVVEESPLEKTRTKDTTHSVIEKDTTPEEAREMAEAAVAGDNPVIESEVALADVKDAPATTTTEDGGKAASTLEDLERGPEETVAEPGHVEKGSRSRSSSVTAEDVDRSERFATPVEEPTTVEEGTAEPLSKQETRHSTVPASPVTTSTPAATSSSPVRSPTQQKKKNRFSSLFSRNKKDAPSNYTYREVGTPKSASAEPTTTTATPAATRELDEDEPEIAHVADTSAIAAGTQHTHSRSATLDERADTEPEDEEEPEPVVPDNRSITEIAATTPLPQPAYTEKTKAKHEKARKQKEYEDMVKKEKARREAELLYKRDRIMNAYTGKQDFSKVPKPSRTKNFGKSIHTNNNKEGADPIQHITKSDKKAYQAEEAAETHSRGSSIHEEQADEDAAPPDMVALNLLLHGSGNEENTASTPQSPVVAEEKPAVHSRETTSDEPAVVDATTPPTVTSVKKRKSVKKTGTAGTTSHRRKSSADAGLSPLTPVTASGTAPTSPVSPTSPTSNLKKRASVRSNKSTRDASAVPHKKETSAESAILPEQVETKSHHHKRMKSGDSAIGREDHTMHLTGNNVDTGLIRKPSTKSNRTTGTSRTAGTSRRKSTEPAKTSDGVAV